MRRVLFSIAFIGLFLSLNSCGPTYVSTQPTYVERARPLSPNPTFVWVDGEWVWDASARTYVRREGYWVAPLPSKTFVPGHWGKTNRGYYWVKGHWQ